MKLDFDPQELDRLADTLAVKVAEKLKSASKDQTDKVFNVKELAQYLGQKPSWIYAHIGEIPHVKKGGLLMFKKSLIDKWLEPVYCPTALDSLVLNRRGGYEKG
ncbi:MAG: helix-turn-helix domain-containing protein [Candidatus Brocadiaceae bacterium]|nr:helix-turn-helix domain-containing protein [Candidatus Brocadiaceae bacterium]